MRRPAAAVLAIVVAALAACSEAEGKKTRAPAATSERAADPVLAEAQDWLAGEVAAQPGQLSSTFHGAPADLGTSFTIDLESAAAATGVLEFVRLEVGPATTNCERILWQPRAADASQRAGRAERASTPTATLRQFLGAVRVLPTLRVAEPESPTDGAAESGFFVLVRIVGSDAAPDRVLQYAGLLGEKGAPVFAGPRAVAARANAILRTLHWTALPEDAHRTTHFSDAFLRDRDLLAAATHTWVVERCAEALGWFGNATCAAPVIWLREHMAKSDPRVAARLQLLVDESDTYFDGPPRNLPER